MQREDFDQLDIPDEPGVYRFQKGRSVLYVGKAASLRDRVRSYFAKDLADTRSSAIAGMVAEADTLTWETTESVLEALILEANLIKKLEPPYNIASKDNTSFNYLVITKEVFPKVLVVRGRDLFTNWQGGDIKHLFGPFPQGLALRDAMKMVRRIFPYRDDKCTPCEVRRGRGPVARPERGGVRRGRANLQQQIMRDQQRYCRPCFNRQIGMCPGVCTGETDAREYANTIRNIVFLFSGKKKKLIQKLETEMQDASEAERYEDAALARRQIAALTHINDISLIKSESRFATGGVVRSKSSRIEAYDIAHTAGTETVGVMVAVEDGEPLKSAYRKFRVRGFTNNDPGALAEVLSRRFLHPEWAYPRVIVVDGSAAQINAAKKVLANAGIQIALVGVVKDERHRPSRFVGDQKAIAEHERDILLANNEAHRFAINYHRKRQRKAMV
ncbi:MAG TPA: UvrB/UvrC motif-containing protein [Candidatus Paceibacterota bacterium]|nr:UvrB/UvrC motif-containing protein [Candidatus Paceibacterota bacterium]